ncbi:MAG: RNA methyltransferase [Clostridiales bacterium]|jgi:TrmH family RNA methyltransferase|nr:RNA methyltransferase [Clostridiales bacterium]
MITSAANDAIKAAASLKDKKFRREYRQYLIEGARLLLQGKDAGVSFCTVYVTESADPRVRAAFPEAIEVSDAVMEKLSDTVTPQGAVGVARLPGTTFAAHGGRVLVLDGVSNPDNMGAILRSAAAFGIKHVYLADCADPFAPKCVRASMGGVFALRLHECGIPDLVTLKANGTALFGTDMRGIDVASAVLPPDAAIVIGGEAFGMRPEVRALCREHLSIPIRGIESLNAAVAAGIILYTVTRQV